MAKLIVMLRVKNGIFFVHDWLQCFEKIADEIVVVDNGSTDGTYEVLKAHPKVVDIARTTAYNEGYDKNLMYSIARKRNPDWCLWLDVDEIFEPQLTRAHFEKLMRSRFIKKYAFRRFHFIDNNNFAGSWFRLKYISGHDRIMWRESPTGHFQNLVIDSPNVKGISGLKYNTNFRLKHLGYINKTIVDQKALLYRSLVPEKEFIIQRMYLDNERPIRWNDDRRSIEVQSLNYLLNLIQLMNLFPRGFKKAMRLVAGR